MVVLDYVFICSLLKKRFLAVYFGAGKGFFLKKKTIGLALN